MLGADDSEAHAGIEWGAVCNGSDKVQGQIAVGPTLRFGIPNARAPQLLVADEDVEITIVVEVDQAHAVIPTNRRTERLAGEQVGIEPFERFAEIEKLHAIAIFADCVFDKIDHLIGPNPSVRMENESEHPLLHHRGVQSHFPICDRDGISGAVKVLGFPIAGDHGGKFPT